VNSAGALQNNGLDTPPTSISASRRIASDQLVPVVLQYS